MSPKAEQLLKQAMQLPPADRVDLGAVLANSAADEPSADIGPGWAEEIERRIHEIDDGKAHMISGEEFLKRMKSRLQERSRG